MSAVFEIDEGPVPLTICPRCGRQIRIDGHCECESIFFDAFRRRK